MCSGNRAETLAEHLEKVQSAVRPTPLGCTAAIAEGSLPVNMSGINEDELIKAAIVFKNN